LTAGALEAQYPAKVETTILNEHAGYPGGWKSLPGRRKAKTFILNF
jgi:hypothetical protein